MGNLRIGLGFAQAAKRDHECCALHGQFAPQEFRQVPPVVAVRWKRLTQCAVEFDRNGVESRPDLLPAQTYFPPKERLTISRACSRMALRWSALFKLSA